MLEVVNWKQNIEHTLFRDTTTWSMRWISHRKECFKQLRQYSFLSIFSLTAHATCMKWLADKYNYSLLAYQICLVAVYTRQCFMYLPVLTFSLLSYLDIHKWNSTIFSCGNLRPMSTFLLSSPDVDTRLLCICTVSDSIATGSAEVWTLQRHRLKAKANLLSFRNCYRKKNKRTVSPNGQKCV